MADATAICGTASGYSRHYNRGEKPCQSCKDEYNRRARDRYKSVQRKCRGCSTILPSGRMRWCSEECAASSIRTCRVCGFEGVTGEHFYRRNPTKLTWGYECKTCAGKKLRQSEAYARTRQRRSEGGYRKPKDCGWCGETFLADKASQRFCGLACAGKWWSEERAADRAARAPGVALVHAPAYYRDLPDSHPAMMASPRPPRTFVAGCCGFCGSPFVVAWQKTARFCSDRCQKKHYRRDRGRFVVPDAVRRAVYERDGWKCQLCGKRVGKSYGPSHQRSATLDHIVPRSQGGPDAPSNLQLAHRICNSLKRDQVWRDGEQLMLLSEVA